MYNVAAYYCALIKFEYWTLQSKFLPKFLTLNVTICMTTWHLHELWWKKNTIFAHPEYALQNQLTIKTNTFSESLYFVLFNFLMTKWWKVSINTGWSRRVNMFLLEFCFVTPCIIFVPPWICNQNLHNEYLHFITFLLIYSLIGLWYLLFELYEERWKTR